MNDYYDRSKTYKEKGIFLFYEFVGTAILTIGYNFNTFNTVNFEIYFICSLLAWEISSAHFNLGTTLTCLVYEIETDSIQLK